VLKAAKASRAEPSLSTAQPAPRPLGDPPAKVGQGFEARTGGGTALSTCQLRIGLLGDRAVLKVARGSWDGLTLSTGQPRIGPVGG
jgi:hypothetical protein